MAEVHAEVGVSVKLLGIPFDATLKDGVLKIECVDKLEVDTSSSRVLLSELITGLKDDIGKISTDASLTGSVTLPEFPSTGNNANTALNGLYVELKKLYLCIKGLGTDKVDVDFALWVEITDDVPTPIIDFEKAYVKIWNVNNPSLLKQMGIAG